MHRPTKLRSHDPGEAAAAAANCAARAKASGPGAFDACDVCDAVVVVVEAGAAAVVAVVVVVEAGAVGGENGGLLPSSSSPSFPPRSTAGFAAQNPGGDRVPRLCLAAESLLGPMVMELRSPRGDREAAAGCAASYAGVAGPGVRVSADACVAVAVPAEMVATAPGGGDEGGLLLAPLASEAPRGEREAAARARVSGPGVSVAACDGDAAAVPVASVAAAAAPGGGVEGGLLAPMAMGVGGDGEQGERGSAGAGGGASASGGGGGFFFLGLNIPIVATASSPPAGCQAPSGVTPLINHVGVLNT